MELPTAFGLLAAAVCSKDGFKLKTHQHDSKMYSNCFRGKEAVDWLHNNWRGVTKRNEGVALCQQLMDAGVILGLTPGQQFSDSDVYYRLEKHYNYTVVEEDPLVVQPEELLSMIKEMGKSLGSTFKGDAAVSWAMRTQHFSRHRALHFMNELLEATIIKSAAKGISQEFREDQTQYIIRDTLIQHPGTPVSTAKIYNMTHIPAQLQGLTYESSKLVYNGYLVAKYRDCGKLALSHITEERLHVINAEDSAITAWSSQKSLVFTLHAGGALVSLDVESRETHAYPSASQSFASSAISLLTDDNRIVALSPTCVVIWDRAQKGAPREFSLVPTISNITFQTELCALLPDNLLLLVGQTNNNKGSLTVWNISESNSAKFSLLYKTPGDLDPISCAIGYKDMVIASTVGAVYLGIWNIHNKASPIVISPPSQEGVKGTGRHANVTAIYMDDWFLLTGDASGSIMLYNRYTGERLYELSLSCGLSPVKRLMRIGKWVFSGHDSTQLAVYDLYREKRAPAQLYTHHLPSNEAIPVRSFRVHPGAVTFLLSGTHPCAVVWSPKLDALDVYLKNPTIAQTHPILPALIYTYRKIVDLLNSSQVNADDVGEYRAIIEWMRATVDWVIKMEHNETTSDADKIGVGGVSFTLLRKMQLVLDDYKTGLTFMLDSGDDVARVFSSGRLRARLDRLNTTLYAALQQVFEAVISGSHISVQEPMFMEKGDGAQFWKREFGAKIIMVDCKRFLSALKKIVGNIELWQENCLLYLMDYAGTGYISQHRFSDFLRGFGPLTYVVQNVNSIFASEYFQGYLSRIESESLLMDLPPGTYMLRLPRAGSPSTFAISVLHNDGKVHHIMIDPRVSNITGVPRRIFCVLDAAGSGAPEKSFGSIQDLISAYPRSLRIPCSSPLSKMRWFFGDVLRSECSNLFGLYMLENATQTSSVRGYFILRRGLGLGKWICSVISKKDRSIWHILISETLHGFQFGVEKNVLPTLPEVVEYYAKAANILPLDIGVRHLPDIPSNITSNPSKVAPVPTHTPPEKPTPTPPPPSTPAPPTATPTPNPAIPHLPNIVFPGEEKPPVQSSRFPYGRSSTKTNPMTKIAPTTTWTVGEEFVQTPKEQSPAREIESAIARAKVAVASIRSILNPNSRLEHPKMVLLSQICIYVQKQIKSANLLPAFRNPNPTFPPSLPPSPSTSATDLHALSNSASSYHFPSPRQQEADRTVLALTLPHIEWMIHGMSNNVDVNNVSEVALILGKLDSIVDAISGFEARRRPVIGGDRMMKLS